MDKPESNFAVFDGSLPYRVFLRPLPRWKTSIGPSTGDAHPAESVTRLCNNAETPPIRL
jgi:hypothetical protein